MNPSPFVRHPESLEQMLDRQHRAKVQKELSRPAIRGSGYMGVAQTFELRPFPMTPLMKKRVEEIERQYGP